MSTLQNNYMWDDAVDYYCEEEGLDASDLYLPEHEDGIKEVLKNMWDEEHPHCEHPLDDCCYYCKMD